jgi:hypothetical protein
MTHALVERLLADCPFLAARVDSTDFDLPTVIFGQVAGLLAARRLAPEEEDRVFDHFHALAESANKEVLDILGTGAIEMFNDSGGAQGLARAKLKGQALAMLEDFRRSWGQPDYGGAND